MKRTSRCFGRRLARSLLRRHDRKPRSSSGSGSQAPVGAERLQLRGLSKTFGSTLAVDALSLSLRAGELLALLGPSGCGKTTTLRMVAGLERPTNGEIVLDGEVLADAESSISPERRKLGMVFQSYALWPHMDVFDNVAYGLRRAGHPRSETADRVQKVLALVGMAGFEKRPVTNLSGGQQQRVAVARALATRPKLLLFDEPLSNLDAVLRESMRFEIRSLQQENGITAIYVTHSQEEALAIADVVGIMNDGRLQQLGTPQELYTRPRNRFVASFVGLANILEGVVERVHGTRVTLVLGNGRRCECERGSHLEGKEVSVGKTMSFAIRPESITLGRPDQATAGDEHNLSMTGKLVASTFSGNLIDDFVAIDRVAQRLRVQSFPPTLARVGDDVVLSMGPRDCVLIED